MYFPSGRWRENNLHFRQTIVWVTLGRKLVLPIFPTQNHHRSCHFPHILSLSSLRVKNIYFEESLILKSLAKKLYKWFVGFPDFDFNKSLVNYRVLVLSFWSVWSFFPFLSTMAVSQEARARNASSSRDVQQWEPLTEVLFNSFFLPRRNVLDTFFRSGYLFDPFLFGSFMDPSEPFALWNTTPHNIWPRETVALSKSRVDWFQTDDSIILCCDLPGMKKYDINVTVENGQILKIGGVWNHKIEDMEEAGGEWWKVEYMRKFLLPHNGNIEHASARMDDGVLDLRIPKLKNKAVKGASAALKVVEVTD